MSERTPGPWQRGYVDGSGPSRITAQGTQPVASMSWGCGCCESEKLNAQQEANARFLCLAVNSHEALVSACEKAEAGIMDWRLGSDREDDGDMRYMRAADAYLTSVLTSLRAALKKAEGEK